MPKALPPQISGTNPPTVEPAMTHIQTTRRSMLRRSARGRPSSNADPVRAPDVLGPELCAGDDRATKPAAVAELGDARAVRQQLEPARPQRHEHAAPTDEGEP